MNAQPRRSTEYRTPDGWRVRLVTLGTAGLARQYLRVTSPRNTYVGDYRTADEALAALAAHGVDPATLVEVEAIG